MKEFDLLLSEAMNVTITRILGDSASECIFRAAEIHLSLRRGEVGEDIGAFCAYLERLLGQEQARIIHSTSLKRLSLVLRQEYEEINSHFLLLAKLYETKFRLAAAPRLEEHALCN